MPTLPESHLDSCPLTCCCASCKSTFAIYTYKAGGDREGLVHDDEGVKTDDGEMSAACILCTGVRDRQGDIINPAGVRFEEHSWNPIVLWDHGRSYNLPIGMTESPKGEYTVQYHADGDFITQKTYFAPDKFSTQIYVLVKGRFVRANSIAVKDLMVEKIAPDPEAGHFKPGKYIAESNLAEVTWTPLPANPEAVASLVSSGRIDGGGFAREELHPLILKSLQPFAAPRNAWSNGYTLKSHTAGAGPDTEKGNKSMAENLRRKAEEMEPMDEGNETLHKDEMPPGAQHLHDHHDLLMAHKAMLEEAKRHQENPGVRELIDAHKDMLDTMGAETRDRFGEEYPDHEGPQEEKSEEPAERDTPAAVGDKEKIQRQGKEGDRVEDEEKSARRRTSNMSKKAHAVIEEAALRTYSREQAAWMADQEELAELEAELESLDKQAP